MLGNYNPERPPDNTLPGSDVFLEISAKWEKGGGQELELCSIS